MVNDTATGYCLNAIPYLGKRLSVPLPPGVNQGEYYTMKLLEEHLIEPGRAVCLDNWFTSFGLANTLLSHGMHLVGTCRSKPQLPSKEVIASIGLATNESVALFSHDQPGVNAVIKKTKSKKMVTILTTMHNKVTLVEGEKTQVHMFYNACKGGTDVFDRYCSDTSVNRKTRRWPLCVFYTLINIIMSNSYIVYKHRAGPRVHRHRVDFLESMAMGLCKPWAHYRYHERLQRHPHLKALIAVIFKFTADDLRPLVHRHPAAGQVQPDQVPPPPPPADLGQPDQPPPPADLGQPDQLLPPPPPADLGHPAVADEADNLLPDAPAPGPAPAPRPGPDLPNSLNWLPRPVIDMSGPNALPFRGGRITCQTRQRCSKCPRTHDFRGKAVCQKCLAKVCNWHSMVVCQDCVPNINVHGNQ